MGNGNGDEDDDSDEREVGDVFQSRHPDDYDSLLGRKGRSSVVSVLSTATATAVATATARLSLPAVPTFTVPSNHTPSPVLVRSRDPSPTPRPRSRANNPSPRLGDSGSIPEGGVGPSSPPAVPRTVSSLTRTLAHAAVGRAASQHGGDVTAFVVRVVRVRGACRRAQVCSPPQQRHAPASQPRRDVRHSRWPPLRPLGLGFDHARHHQRRRCRRW